MSDFTNVPMLLFDDVARARRSDTLSSHLAADSNSNRQIVEDFVRALFAEFGPMTDAELTARFFGRAGHPPAHQDSPRKRRSDLAKRGELIELGVRRGPTGRRMVAWGIPQPFPPVPASRGVA